MGKIIRTKTTEKGLSVIETLVNLIVLSALIFKSCKFITKYLFFISILSILRYRFCILFLTLLHNLPLSTPFGYHAAPITQVLSHDDTHYLVFDQVGEMAASTSYIHVLLPLNISTLLDHARQLKHELLKIQQFKTGNVSQIIMTKQYKELAISLEHRLNRSFEQLVHLDDILPQIPEKSMRYGRDLDVTEFDPVNSDYVDNWLSPPIPNSTQPNPRVKRVVWFIPPIAAAITAAAIPAAIIGISAVTRALVKYEIEGQSYYSEQAYAHSRARNWKHEVIKQKIELNNQTAIRLKNHLTNTHAWLPEQYRDAFDATLFEIPHMKIDYSKPYKQLFNEITDHTKLLEKSIDEIMHFHILLVDSEVIKTSDPPTRFKREVFAYIHSYIFTYICFLSTLRFSNDITDMTMNDDFLPMTRELLRHKRFVSPQLIASLIQSGVKLVGTFMGLYNAVEIRAITNKIIHLSHTQDLLVQVSHKHENEINLLRGQLHDLTKYFLAFIEFNPAIFYAKFNDQLIQFENKVSKLINAVQQLQHRRLAVDWLDQTQLLALHQSVEQYASDHQYTLLTKQPSDYFQLETSYLRANGEVLALLHIPCIMTPSMLSIYRYVPFPIPLPAKTSVSPISIHEALYPTRLAPDDPLPDLTPSAAPTPEALYLVADADMIAIDKDSNFRLLSQADLAGCIQRNHVYLCEQQHVLRTNLTETCLGSLYHKYPKGVRENCRFDRRPLQERVYQMSSNEYLVYSPLSFTTRLSCLNGTSFTADFGQTTRLMVPNGCSIQLKAHTLRVDEKFHLPLAPEISEWKWNPLSLPADLLDRSVHLDFGLNSLYSRMTKLRNDSTLDIELPSLVDKHLWTGSIFGILIWTILALASLTPFAMFAWWYYRRTRRLTRAVRYDGQYVTIPDPTRLSLPVPSPRSLTIPIVEEPCPVYSTLHGRPVAPNLYPQDYQ